jgi:glycosyltransferase involved in cell wall biosynthesis
MHDSLVSVIMPVYNGERFLAESIESILNQTFKNWEMLIINDGSLDGSDCIIKQYVSDSRIKYFLHKKNLGLAATYNELFSKTNSKYIAIQEQDDVSLPSRLDSEVAILNNHPEVKYVFTPALFIDINGNIFTQWGGENLQEGRYSPSKIFYKFYIEGNFIPNPSLMMRDVDIIYDPKFKICNDFKNHLRVCHDNIVYFCKEPLVKVRRGDNYSSVSSGKEARFKEERLVLRSIYKEFSNSSTLPITYYHYRESMTEQMLKEAKHYLNIGNTKKAKILIMKAFVLNRSNKTAFRMFVNTFLPIRLLNLLVSIKK